jgi:hypothetical protein
VKAREAASVRHAPRMYAWCRAARRRTALAPPLAFHVSPPHARAAIAAEGLDTVKRRDFAGIERLEAVFLWGTLTDALYNAWAERGEIWVVTTPGLPLAPDPNECSAWMVSRAIEPSRLLWHGPPPAGEPWHWPLMRAARRAWPETALLGDAFGADSHTPDRAVP